MKLMDVKKFYFVTICFICLSCCFINGCKSMDDLLEEYNSNFNSANSVEELNGPSMIKPLSYDIRAKTSLMIEAPNWVKDYEWILLEESYDGTINKIVKKMSNNNFFYYFSVNDANKVYTLELNAKSKDSGDELYDSALVHVLPSK